VVKGLKPALLAVLKDGEELTGEALLADPARRAALLRVLGREEASTPQTHAANAARGGEGAKTALQDGAEGRRKPGAAPTQQDPWRLPAGLELGDLSPLRGREAEIALRAQAWEVLGRVRALDRATGERYSIRLNRAPTPEVPALLAELQEVLARLEAPRPNRVGRPLALGDIPEDELPF
jgi:hypothetical protein